MCLTFCYFVAEPPSNANPPGELPVTIEHQQDPAMSNNLTRNDANCDKTGTCYDGTSRYKMTCFTNIEKVICSLYLRFSTFQYRCFARTQELQSKCVLTSRSMDVSMLWDVRRPATLTSSIATCSDSTSPWLVKTVTLRVS